MSKILNTDAQNLINKLQQANKSLYEENKKLNAEIAVLRGAIKQAAEGAGQDWLQLQLMLCNVLVNMDTTNEQAEELLSYRRVIDDALVVRHIGVAQGYPEQELETIIDWEIGVHNDPAVNPKMAAMLEVVRAANNVIASEYDCYEAITKTHNDLKEAVRKLKEVE